MLRNCNDVVKLPYNALFVVQHSVEFNSIQESSGQVPLRRNMPPPDFALDVVLKQDRGNRQGIWEIHRCVQKITHRNVEAPFLEPNLELLLNLHGLESAHRIRKRRGDPCKVIDAPTEPSWSALSRTEAD